jgi:hypothetical protein
MMGYMQQFWVPGLLFILNIFVEAWKVMASIC